MSLALKGLAGPLQNKVMPLTVAVTLGRAGDIVVTSSKASSLHASLKPTAEGLWLLEDKRSKNGTIVAGARVESIALKVGLVFYIGDQGFEVVDFNKESPPPPVAPPPKVQLPWQEVIGNSLGANLERFIDRQIPVSPFHPAVVLDFQRGLQVNSRWVLGYGPRHIGADCIDLPIWEPNAPAICFQLIPSAAGTVFQTEHASLVTLNRSPVDSQVLHVGDTIQIFETLIEVDFTE